MRGRMAEKKSLEIKGLSQRMWCTNRLVWHTNFDLYGIRTSTFMAYEPPLKGFMPYEPFLLGWWGWSLICWLFAPWREAALLETTWGYFVRTPTTWSKWGQTSLLTMAHITPNQFEDLELCQLWSLSNLDGPAIRRANRGDSRKSIHRRKPIFITSERFARIASDLRFASF